MRRFSLALLLAAATAAAQDPPLHACSIQITNSYDAKLGVFFTGNETSRRDTETVVDPEKIMMLDFEALTDVLEPGQSTQHGTHFHHAFALRTADFKFRAKVIVSPNTGPELNPKLPYVISFRNVMSEMKDAETSMDIELKHSNTGFVWIKPESEARGALSPPSRASRRRLRGARARARRGAAISLSFTVPIPCRHQVAHGTDADHDYILHDRDHKPIVTIRLKHNEEPEL